MSSRPKGNRSTGPQATATQAAETGEASVGNAARDENIRRRAYEIYLERGEQPGRELDDWLPYMYGGKWVPNKSHAMGSGNEFHVGPHIMIIGLDPRTMQVLNQDGSGGEPYVNHLPGHPELFLGNPNPRMG